MNKKILKQAKLFKNEMPVFSKVRELCGLAFAYQDENETLFLEAKRGGRAKVISMEEFLKFLSYTQNVNVKSFEDIDNLLNSYQSRKDNIIHTGDSKSSFVKVFDRVVLVKKTGELFKLYKKEDLFLLDGINEFVAIENAETFLNIENKTKYFSSEYFIYLSGYANTLTRAFLKTKSVEFFVDYDIEGMNIYESFECDVKRLHIAKDIERYFIGQVDNKELYKKQRANLKKNYSREATIVIELITKYSSVVEQEIIYETY